MCCMHFSGPTWRRPGHESVLLASRRYDGSTSRKTKGSMADTLQCNLWRRAQTPHRMTHSLHGGDNHGDHNGFTALGKTIGTRKSTPKDSEYVEEHSVLKFLRRKLACYLHDFRRHWFVRLRLPPPNGRHDQLYEHQIRRLMRRVVQRSGCLLGAGRGRERPEIQVFSRLDSGHKDFLGEQFVNCRWSRSHHADVRMDFVFFIPPPPFYEGTLADFEPTLDTCWFGRVVLLCRFRVKTDMKDDKGRSVLMDCDCALIDCLYDYAPGGYKCIFVCQAKLCPNNVQTYIKQNVNQTKCKPKHIQTHTTLYQNLANL